MPWKVGSKTAKGWPIINSMTGEVVGHSSTRAKALASIRARYRSMAGKGETMMNKGGEHK